MVNIIKSSLLWRVLAAIGGWFARKWNESEIGWLVTRNLYDVKTRNSLAYRVVSVPFRLVADNWGRAGAWLAGKVKGSVLLGLVRLYIALFCSLNTAFYGGMLFAVTPFLMWKMGNRFYLGFLLLAAAVALIIANAFGLKLVKKSFLYTFVEKLYECEFIPENLTKLKAASNNRKVNVACGAVVGVLIGAAGAAVGFLYPAAAVVALVGVALVLYRFEVGVFALVFLAPFVPTMVCAGLAVMTVFSYVVHCFMNPDYRFKLNVFGFLLLSFILVIGFFAVTSLTPAASIKIFMLYAAFMLFCFPLISTAKTKDMLYKICAVFVTAGLFVALYGIYQQIFGTGGEETWLDEDMFSEIATRVYSTLENPNVLGEYLLMVISMCAALLWTRKTPLSRVFYFGILGASCLCMIFTQSRGCWLGLLLAAAVFALLADKRLVVAGIIGVMLLPFVMPETVIMRFMSIGNLSDSSTSYRVFIWLGTGHMLLDYGLFGLGLGSGAFNSIYPYYSYSNIIAPHAHNIYLQLLVEMGIIGLFMFVLIMVKTLKKTLLGYIADRKGFCGILAAGVIAGLLGFLLQGAFDYVWYNYRVFLMFWMFVAIGTAVKEVQDNKTGPHHQ